jgi:hypothetical protein
MGQNKNSQNQFKFKRTTLLNKGLFFDFSMANKLRASAAVLPEHVIHRGNNRQAVF